jgi:hypothetical protein
MRSIRFRCIDEIDAQLDGAPQDGDRFRVILRRPPHAVAGDAHRAESETVDGKIAAEEEGSALRGAESCGGHG